MKAETLASLESELELLEFRISQLPDSIDKRLVMSQFLTVQDIVNEESNKKLRSLLKRRGA